MKRCCCTVKQSAIMELALLDIGIVVGEANGDLDRVTPGVLIYCEKLVGYIASKPRSTILSTVMIASHQNKYLWGIAAQNADIPAVLRQAIARAIWFEIEKRRDAEVEAGVEHSLIYGMGLLYDIVGTLFNSSAIDDFTRSLNFAIYDCIDLLDTMSVASLSNYSYLDFVVKTTTERLKIPSDVDLVDGMLVSEACVSMGQSINRCVCIEGVPLWPLVDAKIMLTPPDIGFDGAYRLQADLEGGSYFDGLDDSVRDHAALFFTNPTFLQGIKTMDIILGARLPSWKNLQIYQNGQWVNAVAS